MRRRTPQTIPILAATLATALVAGQALADQKPYASVRDCFRSVTATERKIEAQNDTLSSQAKRLLAQARDLCMQTRYDSARDMLSEVTKVTGAQ